MFKIKGCQSVSNVWARATSVVIWVFLSLIWRAHSANCQDIRHRFPRKVVRIKDLKHKILISLSKSLIWRNMTFLMIEIISTERNYNYVGWELWEVPLRFLRIDGPFIVLLHGQVAQHPLLLRVSILVKSYSWDALHANLSVESSAKSARVTHIAVFIFPTE